MTDTPSSKNIIVVGGDGFCGFPLSLRLSAHGHTVKIIDNLSRRKIDVELASGSLTPIQSLEVRLRVWKEKTGKTISFTNLNVAEEYEEFCQVLREFRPAAIVHLGEQRSAPYSMKTPKTRRYTIDNNLNGTHNILCAISVVDPEIHLVHLGTMGVYGYGAVPDTVVPEGYINVAMKNAKGESKEVDILHPAYPGSIYHMTKTQDALFFQFYVKNYQLKITDLHQGIIWGVFTKETAMDDRLLNRFDYDSDYGTVLNRFILQSALGIPLTVYGTGGQTRAFIHLENSMDCIEIALSNPPKRGDRVSIFNQITETHTLIDLANFIQKIYPTTKIDHVSNPRKELSQNDLKVSNQQFLNLGLKPITLSEDRIREVYEYTLKYKEYVNKEKIYPSSFW
jgi:UDP-sulfoquinovose synthase